MPPLQPGQPPTTAQDQATAQLSVFLNGVISKFRPLIDQKYLRLPYTMPLAQSQSIAAGQTNQALNSSDFSNALEWVFEVHKVKFSQDASHTFRDWRVFIRDQVIAQDLMKSPNMVATLVDDNTGAWELEYPWEVRRQGGGLQVFVDNLDPANPIVVDINFIGYLLVPRRTEAGRAA